MAAGQQVRALYDFDGQSGSDELTIAADEVLTVTRTDVGEGWYEGCNSRGQKGLFPAAYVELIDGDSFAPPAVPPPPLPEGYDQYQSSSYPATPQGGAAYQANQNNYEGDDWDDDWDDDDDASTAASTVNHGGGGHALQIPKNDVRSSSAGDLSNLGRGDGAAKAAAVKKNFNRFSTFVKSGGEAYILGETKVNVPDLEKVCILETPDGIMWAANPHPYQCIVASPKKESKLKGLKSYMAYQLTPSFNNIQVSRRYKHFDWLHARLEEKFTLIPIPPLPDKQISGRYEDSFIQHRMAMLQSWVNRITRHPVLGQCRVWKHFLTCTDEKRWKVGKREAEKDEFLGATFFLAIEPPAGALDLHIVEQQTDTFNRFVKNMDDSVKNLQITVLDQIKKHSGPYKREYQKIGNSFKMLASAFDLDTGTHSRGLTEAVRYTGETYEDIGRLFEDQPRKDWEPLSDVLHEYKGMLSAYPDILTVHKGAIQKRKEYEKLHNEGRMATDPFQNVCYRTDVVSYATLAEMNNFQHERVTDFKKAMQDYLTEQIVFYESIVNKLRVSLDRYQNA